MSERQYIKSNIFLCRESEDKIIRQKFTKVQESGGGASFVRYKASRENNISGILTEFYPDGLFSLERNPEGQLVLSQDSEKEAENFEKACADFLSPYDLLTDEIKKGSRNGLSTFLPPFEVYYGCDSRGNKTGTVYIWTQTPNVETFGAVCKEIHNSPRKNPEHKLVTVLNAISSLTKCISLLHSVGIIYRNITPAQFGFHKRKNETLTQTLSMLDVSSICLFYDEVIGKAGTKGYMESEAEKEPANEQTDIYSIGASLFHAIIVSDETKQNGYIYNSTYYDRLGELVEGSTLIRGSEANYHPRLRKILTSVLQKCLCGRSQRYQSCDELLKDIDNALYYALPSEFAEKKYTGEKWVLTNIEKSLDKNVDKNSSLAIKYHLYEKPLYEFLPDNEKTINVMVIGFGNYGQKFLDSCLQAGQMPGKELNVTVISDDMTDKNIYIDERPELDIFFDIDGSLADLNGDPYDIFGRVKFIQKKLEYTDRKKNVSIMQDIMYEYCTDNSPCYIFIALGKDELNYAAAEGCREAADVFEMNCSVNFICEDRSAIKRCRRSIFPIYVNEDITKSALYPEIERMAFNTHLIWEKNLNIDYKVLRERFRKKYNHDSSVSGVLSLKYKLHSIGIDIDKLGYDEAAKEFVKRNFVTNDTQNRVKNELICMEHRRWVTEKLCLGWREITDVKECMTGATKDEKHKRHICITRSRPDQLLAEKYKENSKIWSESDKKLNELDDLDRKSVYLHQMFVKEANKAKLNNLLSGSNIEAIRTLIDDHSICVNAFQEWVCCLQDIWNDDKDKVSRYKDLKFEFLNTVETFPDSKRKLIHDQVKAFETAFHPVLASMEYRDWKQDDVALIDNIPFILTYSEDTYMVIPYKTGSNTDLFDNVAAPTVVNPARIIYLYLINGMNDISELQQSIPYISGYMKKKHFKAAVDFVFIYNNRAINCQNDTDKLDEHIKELSGGRIKMIKHMEYQSNDILSLSAELTKYLRKRAKKKRLFALEKNTANLSYLLMGTGFYDSFSNYTFDSGKIKFENISNCQMFEYITKSPYITVSDMFSFRLTSGIGSHPEFYTDYNTLWNKYGENRIIWKILCNALKEYSQEQDILASFSISRGNIPAPNSQDERPSQTYNYIIPYTCIKNASDLIDTLKKNWILKSGSKVNGYTSDSCKVTIVDPLHNKSKFDKLFSNVYHFMIPEAISFVEIKNPNDTQVNVRFDDLTVSDMAMRNYLNYESDYDRVIDLLTYFNDKGYIRNLSTNNNKVGFIYSSKQVKELLTSEGRVLEIYVYHKIKESGLFDDVVSSYEIKWENKDITNELDCIVTKGFRTLFIECKAKRTIEQDYYFKIKGLAEQFGINPITVLIADMDERIENNVIQKNRGDLMEVVTVFEPNHIRNIAQTLQNIINGTFNNRQ